MKGIMYHYVRPSDVRMPKLKHLHIEDFRRQLDYFEEKYGFVSREAFIDAVKTPNSIDDGVILTFDDGLVCHYEHVYKELKNRGLWGLFYVSSDVYKTQKLLDVHRIHVLLAAVDESEVLRALEDFLDESMLIDAHREEFQQNTYRYQNNTQAASAVKRILNYYIGYEWREHILDGLIASFGLEDLCDVNSFYVTESQMAEMADGGMIIDSHSASHPVMSKLNVEEQELELRESLNFVEPYSFRECRSFCYPYGGAHSYNQETIRLLKNLGCSFAWDVSSRDITVEDFTLSPYTLPRYDCNEFPYGQVRGI